MEDFKSALRRLAKAVVVVTSADDGGRYAMAATAVSEVSMDPASMLVCINRSASLYPVLKAGAPFAVNILHQSHMSIASRCAGAVKGEDRFLAGQWVAFDNGVPHLVDAQASVLCDNRYHIDHGTHGIFIGDVRDVKIAGSPDPLIYLDGCFKRSFDGKLSET